MNHSFLKSATCCLFSLIADPSIAAGVCASGNIRLISPHGSGVSDLMARIMATELTNRLGQTVYVDPVLGAGGAIGVRTIAEAEPDGCTIGIVGLSTLVIGPQVDKNVVYDPNSDFSPLGTIGGSPAVFAVNAKLGITSLSQLMEAMAAGKLVPTISTPGRSTFTAILPESIFVRRGLDAVIVPFEQPNEALAAAVAGDVDAVSLSYSTLRPQIEAGALVPLYVSASPRLPSMPGVPTLTEVGEPSLETLIWFGLAGPKGMNPDLVATFNSLLNAVLTDPNASAPLTKVDITLMPMSPADMTVMVSRQTEAYGAAIEAIEQK
jgi:tripartite-type tricarboxylate transporter receptor subunit TctC